MPVYIWKGKNRFGDIVGGERVARSLEEASRVLEKEQIAVSSITKKKPEITIPFLKRERVPLKELAIYSRQLSVLIDADLPLIQSLNILVDQTKNKYFKKVITTIREDVEAGSTLNQAKRKFPKVFDDLYCNLIASGEQSGSLDIVLQRISEYIEKVVKLRSQVKQAMAYPLAILSFAVLVAIFMMWKVVPVFANLFIDLGAPLPFLTQIVITLSNFISKYIIFLVLFVIVFIFLFRYIKRTNQGRRVIDRFFLKIPIFGDIVKKVAIARLARTLSTLLNGGVPILESLRITSFTAGNAIIEESIIEARKKVSEGKNLTDALRDTEQFPFMVTQMISVGEASGSLDNMLTKIADFYDDEVTASVTSLLSLLEPLLLILVGGMIGTIVVSMYLPIFSLIQQF